MKHEPITELNEQRLDELLAYVPGYTGQNAEKIETLFRQKTAAAPTLGKSKTKRRPKPIWQRALLAACLTLVFLTGMVATNAMVDMSGLYEPILGERASQYLQGIHKTDSSEGILLTVDAAYTDGEIAMVFYTLTDTEGKGRIQEAMHGNLEYNTWLFHTLGISGGSWGQSWGTIEAAPDGNSGTFYATMDTDSSLSERLMTLKITEMKFGPYVEGEFQGEFQYEHEIYGNWNVSFRLAKAADTRVYTLNADLPGGGSIGDTLETVTVTPVSVTLRGAMRVIPDEDPIAQLFDAPYMLITASGRPVTVTWMSASYDGSSYMYRLTGIIPDDLIALCIDGVEYPLE